MDNYLPWPGGDAPVDPETRVMVRYRDGLESKIRKAGGLRWQHTGIGDDIVAYAIVGGVSA